MTQAARPLLMATAIALGFFFLLLWFYVTNVYQLHFFDHGGIVTAYQIARIAYIPYLLWLQYAVGAFFLRLRGREHFIASFLLGTSLWHIVLFIIGLLGLYHYIVMLLLAGGVMLASVPHLASLLQRMQWRKPRFVWDEKILCLFLALASLAFLFFKATYPSGGHDFFNHYFQYYMDVVRSGNLGPHKEWYHYFYSKGMGLYFLSMILLDPFAIHMVGATFIIVAACMVFDMLRKPGHSFILPLWGVLLYIALYIYTPGRGVFAASGGWGDLEKTHEIGAVLMLGCIWLLRRALDGGRAHLIALHAVNATLIMISFSSVFVMGGFYFVVMVRSMIKRNLAQARVAFFAGFSLGLAALVILLINYFATGLPQDQLIQYLFNWLDWKRVVAAGYTLEIYAHLVTQVNYQHSDIPLLVSLPKMIVEYYRLFFLWPLLAVGVVLFVVGWRKSCPDNAWRAQVSDLLIYFLIGLLVAIFCGGRSQFISFFRFSTFNYAPTLIFLLLLWQAAPSLWQRAAVRLSLLVSMLVIVWVMGLRAIGKEDILTPQQFAKSRDWMSLTNSATKFNTGRYSIYEALTDQHGRIGRMKWGGTHPAMVRIYNGLPAGTRVWSFYNQSYCLLPGCNVQQYFSQITSPRWYDIALGSIEDGKKIMQEEGLNFFYYSRNMNTVAFSDTKDLLAGFYRGFDPKNMDKTFGILWSNGWDYLLTWKDHATAPLDKEFLDSWKSYYDTYVLPREERFKSRELATIVKKAVEDPAQQHPPAPPW